MALMMVGLSLVPFPVLTDLIESFIVVSLNNFNNLGKGSFVLSLNPGESHRGDCFPSDDTSQPRLGLDNTVRSSHLTAQSRHPHNQLDRFNVTSNHNQLGLLRLNQLSYFLHAMVKESLLLAGLIGFASCSGLSSSQKSSLLVLRALGTILVQKLEQLGSGLLVQSISELVDWGRNLQSSLENSLLSLQTDILGPFHISGQISPVTDISTNRPILWPLYEQRVRNLLGI